MTPLMIWPLDQPKRVTSPHRYEHDNIYEAARTLRRSGATVYRVGRWQHYVDGEYLTDKQLTTRARATERAR